MNREIKNNQVTLSGEIVSNFEFSHEVFGEGFYTAMLASKRRSSQKDIIPIMVSERLIDTGADRIGCFVKISGQFRSYNKHEGERNRLILSVFAKEFEEYEAMPFVDNDNHICLNGYIRKQPIYRKTPLGREITDILLAVKRPYGKSDYVPMIFWGRNARFVSTLSVGTRLKADGRVQSRTYIKRISDDKAEERTAYEVSANKVEVIENQKLRLTAYTAASATENNNKPHMNKCK